MGSGTKMERCKQTLSLGEPGGVRQHWNIPSLEAVL